MSAGHLKLKPQHAPKAPHEDPRFLESTPARPLRILAEYLHPLVQLKREGIADTIVMFGSARISRNGAGARYAAEKRKRQKTFLGRASQTPWRSSPRQESPRNVSLL